MAEKKNLDTKTIACEIPLLEKKVGDSWIPVGRDPRAPPKRSADEFIQSLEAFLGAKSQVCTTEEEDSDFLFLTE